MILSEHRTTHIVLTAKVEEVPVQVMIDSGANRSYAGTILADKLQTWRQDKERPYPLTMADGTPADYDDGWIRKELRNVRLSINNHEETTTLDIVKIKYDIILGMEWLTQHNPIIDWKKRTLEFPNCRHGTTTEDRSSSKVPFAKAIWVRPRGRFLAEMVTAEIPSEYKDFEDVFTEKEGSAALPKHQPWDHKIVIEEGKVLKHYHRPRPLSKKEEDFLKDYVESQEKRGFVRKSKSPIAHGIVFASKKDGGLRPCVDFRKTNDITVKNRYPLPRIDESQDRLLGAMFFTIIDIRDAFNRIRMAHGEEWKTAFSTRWGLYEYLVMPFGLTNAPATFQELINDTLKEFLDEFCIAYLDDILIFSKTYKEHVQHVKTVLRRLREKDLPVKLSKCEFHKERVAFLGYIVSRNGLEPDPSKIESIKDWPIPQTVKDVQSFLGLANYYRRFIKGFSQLAAPLTELTKKDKSFDWDHGCKDGFRTIKERLTSAPILAIFDPEKEALLETDASDFAIGACLTQKGDDGKIRPVAYYSRKQTQPELNYDIHDKELLAVVEAFKQWRVYLEGTKYPVQVFTDHKNLLYWTTTKELNRRQVRWSETLGAYSFKINHVRGTENGRADALSRRIDYAEGVKPTPASILKVEDDTLVYRKPQTETLALMEIELTDEQKQAVIRERHDDRTAGHQGVSKTIELITRDFLWKGLRKNVEEYVKKCDICARTKHARHKPYGLLQSPALPEESWSSIAIDFITDLPHSQEPLTGVKYDSIMVVVERLTKWAYFIPFLRKATATDLAHVFMEKVFARHGMPAEIISDRDKLFTSQFWQSLMDILGTKHKLSTAYHPQTDGQTERTNQVLEQYLRCYLNYEQNDWVRLLPMAQFAYNNSATPTGISPFYANYGKHPNISRDPRGLKPIADKAKITVSELHKLHKLLQQHLQEITMKTTVQANKKRTEGPALREGGMVYLVRKNIKTKRPSNKLDHTKLGPFRITKKIGKVNYRLNLLENMRIHNVFYISLLELALAEALEPGPVEISPDDQEPMYEVDYILKHRNIKGETCYLVYWKGY